MTVRIEGRNAASKLMAAAGITNMAGTACARATATLIVPGEAQAAAAAAAGVTADELHTDGHAPLIGA